MIAVLFARQDSIYKNLPDCDVYDAQRNALHYRGPDPVVAHPPCRSWGGLSHFAKPRFGERKLAIWAVLAVRRFGGVLEHPVGSRLWQTMKLPAPGTVDQYGGFTFAIDQDWFGHRAQKRTKLYIVGVQPKALPAFELRLEEPEYVVSPSCNIRKGHARYRPRLRKPEREATPLKLAKWLVEVASLCRGKGNGDGTRIHTPPPVLPEQLL